MLNQFQGYIWLFSAYIRPHRRSVGLLAVLLLVSIALQLFNPQILRYFIDTAQQPTSEVQALLFAAASFILVALLTQVLALGAAYVSENLAWTATNDLRADLTMHSLRLDMTFHKARTPGELIERIDGDVTALANFFSQFVLLVLGNVVLMLGVLVVLWVQDWRIGAVLTVLAATLFVTMLLVQRMAVPYWTKARESSAVLFGLIEERLSGTEDIRSSGAIPYTMNRLYERSRVRLREERRAAVVGSVSWLTPVAFLTIASIITYWLGYRFYREGTMTLGTVYLIFFYTDALLRPVIQITRQIEDLQKAGAGVVRVNELYSYTSSLANGTEVLPHGPLEVRFADVTFGYDDRVREEGETRRHGDTETRRHGDTETDGTALRGFAASRDPQDDTEIRGHGDTENVGVELRGFAASYDTAVGDASEGLDIVLRNVDVVIPAGRTLGILGRTGSGKTTLTRLLFRLYDVTEGAIRLNGIDVRDATLDSLRQRVGMVTQEVQLFHATVRDNLTFFDTTISDERITAVLTDLELLPWLASLPNGLDTVLAADNGGLSAGEAQVLAFTRVFLRDPGLIILDEASSRLDPATERLIERAVNKLLADRTGIIIAHRLATVLRADDILILENGSIREYGPTDLLRADPNSRFAQLLRTGLEEELM
jgi:ABC-type multidrug transport system fused ATPase/permease subunit